jgi:cation-transporting ATPase E
VVDGQVNTQSRQASRSTADIVKANVVTRFNALIGALFAVILVIGPLRDGLFGLVIVVNTAIGVVQELRAKATLDHLAILNRTRPRVVRDGAVVEIAMDQVVLDDVIELGPGDQLVADGTVLAATGLEVDESLLTGEADPTGKHPADSLLSGSFVVAGTGHYRVTHVGGDAYAARLAEQASRFTTTSSELRAGIDQVLRWITWLFVPVAALSIFGQVRADQSVTDTLRGTVAALVPMVPEGLVLLTSVAFAVAVVRLGRRQCLVQELPAIEELARVDVVCTDKTGTLTETGMRLGRLRTITIDPAAASALAALAAADARPNASMRAITTAYPDPPDWQVTATAAFSSATKWSGASFADHGDWVLGAADVLLPAGSTAVAEADELSAGGLRVLLLGRSDRAVDGPGAPGVVTPIALVVLEQRIRADAAATLDYFAAQDVVVKVLSGDSPSSVGAITATLGLSDARPPVDARELSADPAVLAGQVEGSTVFGRVTPPQKQAMVRALQDDGHTVAMTGDGVNDVLALKESHVGVAMGSGSPATRAVAQIVLLDNSFATLPVVVAEGRRVIGNIERVATLFLVKTVYSVALAVAVGIARLPFPFLPRHLTLIGALTIGIPSFFLALAPNTERARSGFVARVLRMAIPVGAVAAAATFGCYFLVVALPWSTQTQDRTAAAITLFLIALWALAVVARPREWWRISLVAAVAIAFLLVLVIPWARQFFALDPTDPLGVLVAVGAAASGVAVVELWWWLASKVPSGQGFIPWLKGCRPRWHRGWNRPSKRRR